MTTYSSIRWLSILAALLQADTHYWKEWARRGWNSATLWYHRLQTDKDPRYAVGNLLRLQEDFSFFDPAEKAEVGEMITRIVGHLVMPNGTPMVSRRGRHKDAIDLLLAAYGPEIRRPARVLELGCSLGVDGLEMYRILQGAVGIDYYLMTDLHTQLLYDPRNQVAYDESDGRLVQVFLDGRAISVNVTGYFVWSRWLMRLFNLTHEIRARKFAARSAGSPTIAVPLLHPEVQSLAQEGRIRYGRQDILKEMPGQNDLVIAFNLLVPYYFSAKELSQAARNIRLSIHEGGFMIVGEESSNCTIWSKKSGSMLMRHRKGIGSAFDKYLVQ